jgi:uncharacterized protein (UPF0335 family)
MAKHQVNIIDKSKISNRLNESQIFDDISKREFFKILKDNGYDHKTLKDFFESKKMTSI